MIPSNRGQRGFSTAIVTALGRHRLLPVGIALCGPLRYTNRGLYAGGFGGVTGHLLRDWVRPEKVLIFQELM
jgi:hypothetical protein